MPTPIPEAFAAVLKVDAVAAIAAAFIIGTHHCDVLQWVARMTAGVQSSPKPPEGDNGTKRSVAVRKRRNGGDRRLAKRDKLDEKLLEAMKVSPGASIGDLAAAIGKSRNSTVSALHRFLAANLVVNENRKWSVAEEAAPKEQPPRWTKPLSGAEKAHQVHLTA